MRLSRSRTRAQQPAADSDGLSRRGWALLVGCTLAVAGVLVALALPTLIPAQGAPGRTGSTPQAESPQFPRAEPRPAPLGLPPRPSATQVATVPSQPVNSLRIGDCLETYPSQWADGYPVVDCAAPHIAQLVSRGVLPQPAGTPFPGTPALNAQVTDLCTAPGILNWDWVAVWNEDVLTDLRYPNTDAQWAAGARSYYCFVTTFSRHELTGNAMAGG